MMDVNDMIRLLCDGGYHITIAKEGDYFCVGMNPASMEFAAATVSEAIRLLFDHELKRARALVESRKSSLAVAERQYEKLKGVAG